MGNHGHWSQQTWKSFLGLTLCFICHENRSSKYFEPVHEPGIFVNTLVGFQHWQNVLHELQNLGIYTTIYPAGWVHGSDGTWLWWLFHSYTTLSASLVPDIANSVSQIFLPCLKTFWDIWDNTGLKFALSYVRSLWIMNPTFCTSRLSYPLYFQRSLVEELYFFVGQNQTKEKNFNTSVSMNSDIIHPAIDGVA